jgi:hypothetical protein
VIVRAMLLFAHDGPLSLIVKTRGQARIPPCVLWHTANTTPSVGARLVFDATTRRK